MTRRKSGYEGMTSFLTATSMAAAPISPAAEVQYAEPPGVPVT
jgi:hypothetical protein